MFFRDLAAFTWGADYAYQIICSSRFEKQTTARRHSVLPVDLKLVIKEADSFGFMGPHSQNFRKLGQIKFSNHIFFSKNTALRLI